jgi:uncharacterized protein YcbK (DUF882 family)
LLAGARGYFLAGATMAVLFAAMVAPRTFAAAPQTRIISLYNIHTKESLTVTYKKGGKYVPAAIDQIDWLLRDWRKNEKTAMDPALIDLLWEIHTELGSRVPIHIVSGYRTRSTNEMLRNTVGGQASESRHMLGRAVDVHFPDVPLKKLHYSALIRERGGVGYYPASATPFVHVDTDRVRHWPRLPRHELALLFPDGRTQHMPADGIPISASDARIAPARDKDLALRVADFHAERKHPKGSTPVPNAGGLGPVAAWKPALQPRVMSWAPRATELQPIAAPKLIALPRLVGRPSRLTTPPTDDERRRLTQLIALASRRTLEPGPVPGSADGAAQTATDAGRSGWVTAPAYDDEHPEELSYRPFSLAPYMTETASPDDPALARLVHPDAAKALELLEEASLAPSMKLRPGQQVARLSWAQQFNGKAVAVIAPLDPPADASDRLANRRVKTLGN